MSGLYFVLPTLIAVLVSMLVVRAGAIAFVMTGMDIHRAKFQALSAFSGTGFTTREAEQIVNHPTRRRIATWLMIMGNAGIVAVIVTGTSSLVTSEGLGVPISAVALVLGLALVYFISTRAGLIKSWESFVQDRLGRTPEFEERPVEELLHFLQGYQLVRVLIDDASPLAGRTLAELDLPSKGCLVLGIERGKHFSSAPSGRDTIEAGDRIVVYGRTKELESLVGKKAMRNGV
ncbi:MAG TPA: TrkA C-terminal domain-containing protein [Sandaracinaceae bacterium LLY-WYZ-13_1]|nr:TrkA C-terminal domain-containing protein [Sandaracinaceae bacterium LLY-WYZ-13_1]